jgi:hypothetical protein
MTAGSPLVFFMFMPGAMMTFSRTHTGNTEFVASGKYLSMKSTFSRVGNVPILSRKRIAYSPWSKADRFLGS